MDEEKASPFADLVTGAAWLAVAIAAIVGAWRMDRLEHLSATIYTAPGLVPGLLGAAIALMAVILMLRAVRAGAVGASHRPTLQWVEHWRLAAALVLAFGFAVGLVAHGMPFWLASAIFVAAFVFVFQFDDRRRAGTLARGALLAAAHGIISGLAIHYLFQDLFLVRLP